MTLTDLAAATLEQRVAALEAVLAPRAAVPPMTIGELANVPVPGASISSPWAQDISSRVNQRFPTTAALKAWVAPAGAFAVALDTGIVWRRVAAGWSQVTPWMANVAGGASQNGIANTEQVLATLNIPADPAPRSALVSALVQVEIKTAAFVWMRVKIDGFLWAQFTVPTAIGTYTAVLNATYPDLPTGRVVPVTLIVMPSVSGNGIYAIPGSDVGTGLDNNFVNHVSAIVTPRGY